LPLGTKVEKRTSPLSFFLFSSFETFQESNRSFTQLPVKGPPCFSLSGSFSFSYFSLHLFCSLNYYLTLGLLRREKGICPSYPKGSLSIYTSNSSGCLLSPFPGAMPQFLNHKLRHVVFLSSFISLPSSTENVNHGCILHIVPFSTVSCFSLGCCTLSFIFKYLGTRFPRCRRCSFYFHFRFFLSLIFFFLSPVL
jgi:hypothetical protein